VLERSCGRRSRLSKSLHRGRGLHGPNDMRFSIDLQMGEWGINTRLSFASLLFSITLTYISKLPKLSKW
jgi:hypothetical protein